MQKTLLIICTLFIGLNLTAARIIASVDYVPVNAGDPASPLDSSFALPLQVPPSNPGKLVAYDWCGYGYDDTGELFCSVGLVSEDGSWQGRIIEDAIDPAWSPDGSRIAFVSYSQPGLFVYDLNSGSIASVHDGGESPAWSPDGTKLAFSSGELFVINADGSAVVQLTNNVGFQGQPSWSSDGATIAFDCVVESGNYDICSINADGTGFIRLTSDPAWDSGATFSPDGSAISLATTRYGYVGIATMNRDGTGISPVGAGTFGFQPAWSSDSTRIAFVQPFVGSCEADWRICYDTVFIMNRDGSGRQTITSGNRPAWAGSSGDAMAWPRAGVCNGLDCTFDGSLSWGGSGTLSYNWDFGDGTSGSGPTVTHTYAAAGTYTVRFTVTDETGATSSRSRDTNVDGNVWPTARFTYTCTGWQCNFDGSGSSDPDGTIERYHWYFGDGSSTFGQTATHSYNAAGPFTVTLYVTDNGGSVDTEQQVVNLVANSRPIASFTAACTLLTCTFDGSGSSDADGVIENYAWKFGDGTGGSGVTASHTYPWTGSFTVSLTVTDNIGGTSVQVRLVPVSRLGMHVGDLDGTRTKNQNAWTALVTITIHDSNHNPVSNATVSGSWSIGGAGSCTTDGSGRCQMSRSTIPRKTQSVTFTVTNVTQNTGIYDWFTNHDPDGDSNGTSITVRGP